MANGVGKHKLLVIGPIEPWSVREKLCLATSVMKSGDQNWVSVSRAIKPFAEPGRPPDWFSQKHCASKYSELLETTEAPKRKRGEKSEVVETVEDVIVRRLTADRIDELKRLIKETQEKHRKLKREAELIQAGRLDSKLEELWEEVLQKEKLEEEETELKRKNTNASYQGIFFTLRGILGGKHQSKLMSIAESSGLGNDDVGHGSLLDDPTQKKLLGQKATPPPSPLLSELLKKGSILATNSRLVCGGDLLYYANSKYLLEVLNILLKYMLVINLDSYDISLLTNITVEIYRSGHGKMKLNYSVRSRVISLPLQADEIVEALDAAAVEAALSLCEENGHALSGAWEAGPFQPHESHPAVPTGDPQSLSFHSCLEGKTELLEVQRGTSASLSSVCNSQDNGLAAFPMGLRGLPPTSSSSRRWIQPPYGLLVSTAPHNRRLHPQQPCLITVVSETHTGTHCKERLYFNSVLLDNTFLMTFLFVLFFYISLLCSSVCSEDLEALQAHKIWKKAIMLVWRAAANHRYANVFLQPVTDEIAPGYHSIVQRPMDLAAIKKNIETGVIRTTAEFQRDIMLMFQNAVMYNSLDHDVYHMALEMQRDVLEQIQQFLATQLIMETSESGISAKSLRGRESTRKQDSTDKDIVSMSSPAFLLSLFDGGTRGRRCAIEADLKMKK
uniref:Bromodomain-containing protein 8 n=1 Tax=Sander lucioperca TaxID=283035 RepID=A0A8D0CSH9_SANLU